MSQGDPERLRSTFDQAAELYDRVRRRYPPALVDDLAELTGIRPAPGSWRSARGPARPSSRWPSAAARSLPWSSAPTWRPSPAATWARFPAVEVVTAAFEDWPLPSEPFDVVLAATAFHWIDPAVRLAKTADALRPGGWLATIATHHVAGGDEAFFAEAQECYIRWDPATPAQGVTLPAASRIPSSSDELDRSRRFGPAEFRRYEWDHSYTTAGYRDLLLTYSGHRDLDPTAQTGLLDCISRLIDTRHGGRITKR